MCQPQRDGSTWRPTFGPRAPAWRRGAQVWTPNHAWRWVGGASRPQAPPPAGGKYLLLPLCGRWAFWPIRAPGAGGPRVNPTLQSWMLCFRTSQSARALVSLSGRWHSLLHSTNRSRAPPLNPALVGHNVCISWGCDPVTLVLKVSLSSIPSPVAQPAVESPSGKYLGQDPSSWHWQLGPCCPSWARVPLTVTNPVMCQGMQDPKLTLHHAGQVAGPVSLLSGTYFCFAGRAQTLLNALQVSTPRLQIFWGQVAENNHQPWTPSIPWLH